MTTIGFGAFQIPGIKVNTSDLTAFAKITPIMDRDTRDYGSFYPEWKLYVNNSEVTELSIPESITSLGAIFAYCKSLTSVTIHKNVTEISKCAFIGCSNINKVVVMRETPVNITDAVRFDDTVLKNATLVVPKGTTAAYKSAGWKFTNIEEDGNTGEPDPQPEVSVTITAKSYSRVYGDANPTFEYTTEGGTLSGTPSISCEATATSPVGTYDIVIVKGSVTNGKVTYVNGKLTITKAPLKIKAGSYTKKQGEENPAFTLTYEGFKNSETEAVLTKKPTVSCSATKDSPAGDYDVTVSGAEATNYEISYTNGKLTITSGDTPAPQPGALKDGDTFQAAVNGTTWNFKVLSASAKTCQVGMDTPLAERRDDYWGDAIVSSDPENVTVPSKVTATDGMEYTVTAIGENAFASYGMKSATLPNTIKKIGGYAFYYCRSMETISMPEGLTEISIYAFGASGLTTVKIPSTVTFIGSFAFWSCRHLTEVTCMIESPLALGNFEVFGNRSEMTLIVPAGKVSAYKNAEVWKDFGTIKDVNGNTDESDPQPKTPDEPLKDFTEQGATYTVEDGNTVSVDIDSSVSGSYEVPETVMHNGVEYQVVAITEGAFENQTGLTEITLPSSVVSIGENAFAGCVNLKAIYVYATTPASLGVAAARTRGGGVSTVFDGVDMDEATLYVPKGCVEKYRAAEGWKDFKNIVEMGSTGIGGIMMDGEPFDVYNLQGRKVLSRVTSLDGLPKGVYIVRGRKVIH